MTLRDNQSMTNKNGTQGETQVALTKVALLRDEMYERVRASIKAEEAHELRSDAVYVCGALDAILDAIPDAGHWVAHDEGVNGHVWDPSPCSHEHR